MLADALTVVGGVAVLISRQLGAQTEHVDQEDPRLDTLSARLEPGNDDPANALGEKVRWPKRFVLRLQGYQLRAA